MICDQRRVIWKSFITLHFSYCPIVWIFLSRKLNERISHTHERALTIVYRDLSFQELLIEDNSLNIHHRNLQKLVTKIDIFKFIEKPYSLQATLHLKSRRIRAIKYGIEISSYVGPKLWNLVPNKYKIIESMPDFKAKIKTWVREICLCRLCTTYIYHDASAW